ncbi:MAG: hypothetical protein L6V82_05325 [Clostridiales bacterium]|nr:MAG: hypothetical protein L6V82_05325 [Clostridiales bacterium]
MVKNHYTNEKARSGHFYDERLGDFNKRTSSARRGYRLRIPRGKYSVAYDELSRSDIRHILPADERGAAFMANGYARATNKVGVCIATSGPGATNLVTGIADAFSDSVPLVVITGNVSVDTLGHDGFRKSTRRASLCRSQNITTSSRT